MSPSLLDFLRHIEHECHYLLQVTKGKTRNELFDDETLSRAIVRSLEIIGEATKKLPAEFRTAYPQVVWKDMAGMRDIIVHHYFGIDNDAVWNTIQNDVPGLHHEIKRIIEIESKKQ